MCFGAFARLYFTNNCNYTETSSKLHTVRSKYSENLIKLVTTKPFGLGYLADDYRQSRSNRHCCNRELVLSLCTKEVEGKSIHWETITPSVCHSYATAQVLNPTEIP